RLADHYGELAHHFAQGEEWQKAMEYSLLAGDRAASAFANLEAKGHYARALQAAGKLTPSPDLGVLASLQMKRGVVLMVLGEYDEAEATYQRALELVQRAGERRREAEVLVGLTDVYYGRHRGEPAIERNEHAFSIARELGDRGLQAVCLASRVLTRSCAWGQVVETTPDAEEALRLSQEIGDPRLLARTLVLLGLVFQWRANFDQALVYLHQGAELAERTHVGVWFSGAGFHIGHANLAKGEYEEALRWYRRLSNYASVAGDRLCIARVPNAIGGVHLELFDLDGAIRINLEADEVARKNSSWPEPRGHSLLKVGLAHLQQGEHGLAEAFFQKAWALLEEDVWMRWRWYIPLLRARGELALAEGRHEEAWSYAAQSLEMATQTDSRKHIARAQWLQGEILAASGQLEEGAQRLAESVRLAETIQTPREIWMGKASLGKVLAQMGKDKEKEAEAQFLQAAQTIEALAGKLKTPNLRQCFLGAEPVLEVYRALGHHPPQAIP
ncbi:MAG: tetratricopeptide repeat protein, partial [Candidatus Tectomicrobia bacterium]|nr:tetratricopeptide repeat protein [Candidatus Tectomicrobia bacterium]